MGDSHYDYDVAQSAGVPWRRNAKDFTKRPLNEILKREFLRLFFENKGRNITLICWKVGISKRTYQLWRDKDKDFAEKVDEIRDYFRERVEEVLQQKALQGHTDALRFYLEAEDPGKYGRGTKGEQARVTIEILPPDAGDDAGEPDDNAAGQATA